MLSAIAGDIIGSVYEFSNYKATDFHPLIHARARFTDDTVCTVAIADCILNEKAPADALREWYSGPHISDNGLSCYRR